MVVRRPDVKGSITAGYTLPLMILGGTLVTASACIESIFAHRQIIWWMYAAGVLACMSSFVLRAFAARALGRYWSMQIELRKDQPLVRTGPFAWVRHPIYTAALLETASALVLCQAYWSMIPAVTVLVPCVLLRIKLEERAMLAHFGEHYAAYMKEVPPLIAFSRFSKAPART